jgi:hypothetical protein
MQAALELAGREKCLSFFSVQCSIGRLSMGQRSTVLQNLILIDVLSSAYWEKEKQRKGKWLGGGFPRAGHALLAVSCGIFMAVRCE